MGLRSIEAGTLERTCQLRKCVGACLAAAVGVYGVLERPANASATDIARMSLSAGREDSTEQPPWSDSDLRMRIGSGFFLSSDGLIATAAHVVVDVPQMLVKLSDRRILKAEFVAADEDADIALIRVATTLQTAPPLGSSASVRAGDWVVAVGEPYGLDRSVVAGIVGVVGINGRPIGDSADMARALLGWRCARGTTITVFRDGRYRHLVID